MRLFAIVCILISAHASAQSPLEKKGDAFYKKNQYFKAAHIYRKTGIHGPSNDSSFYYFIESLIQSEDYEEALFYIHRKEEKSEIFNGIIKQKIKIYLYSEDFKSARATLDQLGVQDKDYIKYQSQLDSISYWSKSQKEYSIENISSVNSPFSDFAANLYQDDLLFCSNRETAIIKSTSGKDGLPFTDFFISKNTKDSSFQPPQPFSSSLNTPLHEGPACFSKNHDTIYFSRNGVSAADSHLKLFSASRTNGRWTKPKNFMLNDSTYSFAHPCISHDGNLFFFASDMSGGYGGTDIYVCIRIDSSWSHPINLGPNINTGGNEVFPHYSSDGDLYFSSDGHFTIGGLDIFRSAQQHGEWQKAVNLGLPVNSPANDIAFYLIEKKNRYAFIASNRKGGKGREDIYLIKKSR